MTSRPGTKAVSGLDEVLRALKSSEAEEVFRQNGVLAAYLFGSVVSGKTHGESDVDVAVVFERSVPKSEYFDRRIAIWMVLSSLLKTDDVDVVPLNEAPVLLTFEALRDPRTVFVADEDEAARFKIKAFSMYWDFRPVLNQYGKCMFQRIMERGLR